MKDSNDLEELIKTHIKAYEEGYNAINPGWEIKFEVTISNHKVELQNVKKDVAYLRLTRSIRPKVKGEEKPEEWEQMLVYNQAYKFENIKERLDPKTPYKATLYMDLLGRLIAGGLEYSELIKRAADLKKANPDKPISEIVNPTPEIVITDQMPAPLTDDEKNYKEWAKKNNKQETTN